jgi:hypothetical protein
MNKRKIKIEDLVVGKRVLLASGEYDVEYAGIDDYIHRLYFKPAGKTRPNEFSTSNFNGEQCFCFDIDSVRTAGLKEIISDEEFFDITYSAVIAAIHTVIRS